MSKQPFILRVEERYVTNVVVYANDPDEAYEAVEEMCNEGVIQPETDYDDLIREVSDSVPASEYTLSRFGHRIYDAENPETKREEWFGVVRWHEDDIEAALVREGCAVTPEHIRTVREQIESSRFHDYLVEAGWDFIHAVIANEIIRKDNTPT